MRCENIILEPSLFLSINHIKTRTKGITSPFTYMQIAVYKFLTPVQKPNSSEIIEDFPKVCILLTLTEHSKRRKYLKSRVGTPAAMCFRCDAMQRARQAPRDLANRVPHKRFTVTVPYVEPVGKLLSNAVWLSRKGCRP